VRSRRRRAATPPQVRLAIYIKGDKRRCTDVPAALRDSVALCRVTHNSGGREAHTIALFAHTFYDDLPRLTIFAQDDGEQGGHHSQLMRLSGRSGAALAAWADAAERQPFAEAETCLCQVVVEDWWNPCPEVVPFPEGTPRCYGDTYWPMRWLMESFLGFPDAGNWRAVRWPEAAQLVVPAWAVRSRPRLLYALALQLLNGSATGIGESGQDQDTNRVQLLHRSARLGYRPWNTHEWSHVFERLWFAVFDARYTPAGPAAPPAPAAPAAAGAAPAARPEAGWAGRRPARRAAPLAHAHAPRAEGQAAGGGAEPDAVEPDVAAAAAAVAAAALDAAASQAQPGAAVTLAAKQGTAAAAAAKAAVDAADGLLFDLRLPGGDAGAAPAATAGAGTGADAGAAAAVAAVPDAPGADAAAAAAAAPERAGGAAVAAAAAGGGVDVPDAAAFLARGGEADLSDEEDEDEQEEDELAEEAAAAAASAAREDAAAAAAAAAKAGDVSDAEAEEEDAAEPQPGADVPDAAAFMRAAAEQAPAAEAAGDDGAAGGRDDDAAAALR
jgi:hypothetical protein